MIAKIYFNQHMQNKELRMNFKDYWCFFIFFDVGYLRN